MHFNENQAPIPSCPPVAKYYLTEMRNFRIAYILSLGSNIHINVITSCHKHHSDSVIFMRIMAKSCFCQRHLLLMSLIHDPAKKSRGESLVPSVVAYKCQKLLSVNTFTLSHFVYFLLIYCYDLKQIHRY